MKRALSLIAALAILTSIAAQNMGQQYINLVTVADTVYHPPYEISLVSENEFPGESIQCGQNILLTFDTLKADVQKDWADQVVLRYGEDDLIVAQKPLLRKFYMASFMNRQYYYICRENECRWLTPAWAKFDAEEGERTMRFEADFEWPPFETTFSDIRGTMIVKEFSLLPNGDKFTTMYIYNKPQYEVYY